MTNENSNWCHDCQEVLNNDDMVIYGDCVLCSDCSRVRWLGNSNTQITQSLDEVLEQGWIPRRSFIRYTDTVIEMPINNLPINEQEDIPELDDTEEMITVECISCAGHFDLREMSTTEHGLVCDDCFIPIIRESNNEDEEELNVLISGISEKCLPHTLKTYEELYKKENKKYGYLKKNNEEMIKTVKEYYENQFKKWELKKEEFDFQIYSSEVETMHQLIHDIEDRVEIADKRRTITLNAINMFKERISRYETIEREYSKTEKNEECIICYISNKTIELKCKHRMCRDCVSRILRCPYCRRDIKFDA